MVRVEWLGAQVDAYAATAHPPLHAVLVLQHREVLLERYWHGFTPQSYHRLNSVTKSVLSALVGLAIGDGMLSSDDTLGTWFDDLGVRASRYAAMVTVRQLLTMTTGFRGALSRGQNFEAPDPLPLLLGRGVDRSARHRFRYEDADANLLAILLERAVGEPVVDYAYRCLFTPLGIWSDAVPCGETDAQAMRITASDSRLEDRLRGLWDTDRQSHARGAYGLHFTAHEMARFGFLYLHHGRVDGQQLVPEHYVRMSITAHSTGGPPEGTAYGYLWWVDAGGEYPAFFAAGYGGQYIYVVPTLDLVIVVASGSNQPGQQRRRMLISALIRAILE